MNQSIEDAGWIGAAEAAALLGIKRATLYAYVSRGQVASRRSGAGRERRYRRADLEALRDRGRQPSPERALRWGDPILESSITDMTAEGPAYRGRPALELASRGVGFEQVAELLWTGTLPEQETRWEPLAELEPDFRQLASILPPAAPPHAVLSTVVALSGAQDHGRYDTTPASVIARARHVIRIVAASLALPRSPARAEKAWRAPTIAAAVARALGAPRTAEPALDRALVLLADHELNASTFAARVVASTGADLYACVQAGMAALSGPLHGAATDRVEALLAEAVGADRPESVVQERMRRGERLPGFGHPFYPAGDPRARLLFEDAWAQSPRTEESRAVDALVGAMERAGRPAPNLDVGLVALRAALSLPVGSAAALFCVGRCAGWAAHALEQARTGHVLRPRARYREHDLT